MQIKNKNYLEFDDTGRKLYGYNQDWFSTEYKRTRGCGPTVATMMLNYMATREAVKLPFSGNSIAEATTAMEQVWEYFIPNALLGLYSSKNFCLGGSWFIFDYGLSWKIRRLRVALLKKERPSLKKTVDFIKRGLDSDCPVAFLNLHKGKSRQLESWHWNLIVGIEEENGHYIVTCYDNGAIKNFNLGLWLATSKIGGGFVYFIVKQENV